MCEGSFGTLHPFSQCTPRSEASVQCRTGRPVAAGGPTSTGELAPDSSSFTHPGHREKNTPLCPFESRNGWPKKMRPGDDEGADKDESHQTCWCDVDWSCRKAGSSVGQTAGDAAHSAVLAVAKRFHGGLAQFGVYTVEPTVCLVVAEATIG